MAQEYQFDETGKKAALEVEKKKFEKNAVNAGQGRWKGSRKRDAVV